MDSIVVCGFSGIGKTCCAKNNNFVIDIDSSTIEHDKDFANKYLALITEAQNKFRIILVSTHPELRQLLKEQNIRYYLVYPKKELCKEYIGRFIRRNNSLAYCNHINRNWNMWIDDLKRDEYADRIELDSNHYLEDIIDKILGE